MRKPPITLKSLTNKKTWSKILGWLLCAAIVVGLVCGAVALFKAIDSDSKTVVSNWSRGTLDKDGQYAESKGSIYTKKAFECAGLEISLDFDAEITYKVVFYDEDGNILEAGATTEELRGRFTADKLPEDAYYARVIVTPTNDSNVTNLEVLEYAKQITITVEK